MPPSKRAAPTEGEEPPAKRTKRSPSPEEQPLDMIAALYWDLNAVCHYRQIVLDSNAEQAYDQKLYDFMCQETDLFIEHAVSNYLANSAENSRCKAFIQQLGWKLLSICGHADAFRRAYWKADEAGWDSLVQLIARESRSIEVFARSRRLEWRGPLLVHARHDLPDLRQALAPEINIAKEHPHHTVRLENDHLERPRYKGKAQVNINSQYYDAEKYGHNSNPLRNLKMSVNCNMCGESNCACRFNLLGGDLVELMKYPGKGTGVRALANFKRGDFLGEFVGEVVPLSRSKEACDEDNVYPLTQVVYTANNRLKDMAHIGPAWLGNWTRFINHSCNASTGFWPQCIGGELTTVIKATRDIQIFEELTVDYGDAYWSGSRECLCGSSNCCKPPKGKSMSVVD